MIGDNLALIDEIMNDMEERPIDRLVIGEKYTCAKVGDMIGFAHTMGVLSLSSLKEFQSELIGKKVLELARSENLLEATVGTASVNAHLSSMLKDGTYWDYRFKKTLDSETSSSRSPNDINIFYRILKKAKSSRKVGVVGNFPFIPKLPSNRCVAFEMEPADGFLPPEMEKEIIPLCDMVVITGTSFTNHTMDELLNISKGYTLVVGPTTPLSRHILNRGADVIAGVVCRDDGVFEIVRNGGGTKDFIRLTQRVIIEEIG